MADISGPLAGAESDRQSTGLQPLLSRTSGPRPSRRQRRFHRTSFARRPRCENRQARFPPSGERLTIRIVRGPARDPEIVKRLILEDPGIVEEGLRILDAHLRAGCGSLIDLFGVDPLGDFVLLELDRAGEEELLKRIRGHQAWVAAQALFLRRLYAAGPIHPFRPPRVIVLSGHLSEGFIEAARGLTPPPSLLNYRILVSEGRPMLYLEPAERDGPSCEAPIAAAREDLPAVPERLTPEEWEAFYGYEQQRLVREGPKERVKG